ncbi:hypothetical protein M758_5G091900 [Ceratodon purpureus]|nr:hypothetical protein M758_5G091900 [Ceratodon purpureus]
MQMVGELLLTTPPLEPFSATSPATLVQTPPLVQVPAAPAMCQGSKGEVGGRSMLEDDAQFQDRSPPPHRKTSRQGKHSKQVKGDDHGESIYGHRLLVGSSAPTCQGKCGQCNPCSPIHMAIGSPHGALTQQEYYPEVWRCKCGGIYFMP